MIKKKVKAVPPFHHQGINFKDKAYKGWIKAGGEVSGSYYPPRIFHHFAYRYGLPDSSFLKETMNAGEARLRFVQPETICFDSFPDYMFYELIPFVWDCWPRNFDRLCKWLNKYKIKTMIVTCHETKRTLQEIFPYMNILSVMEGIDTCLFEKGKELKDRTIDYLEYGRNTDKVVKYSFPSSMRVLRGQAKDFTMIPYDKLFEAMKNSKIVVAYPKTWTNPELAGGLETLTQRYWECMLSRMVMIGHAPKELVDFVGYNPVIEVNLDNPNEQLQYILHHIEDYQELVDKNRETALLLGSWELRMKEVMKFLRECGYEC